MKRVIATIALLTILAACALAQSKFAHIDTQALLTAMPQRDSAMAKLKALEAELTEQLEQLQVEFNKKYQEYSQKRDTFTPAIRDSKEKELTELQQRVQEFQIASERDFRDMQGKLMQPIIEKAQNAIRKVGKENGFIYVFDTSAGAVIYHSQESVDLLPLVKKELAIKAK